MSDNTYSSDSLRIITINDNGGKHIKNETLFLNIDDYWTNFHSTIYFLEKPEYLFKFEKTEENGKHMCQISIFFSRELKTWMGSLPQHFI